MHTLSCVIICIIVVTPVLTPFLFISRYAMSTLQ